MPLHSAVARSQSRLSTKRTTRLESNSVILLLYFKCSSLIQSGHTWHKGRNISPIESSRENLINRFYMLFFLAPTGALEDVMSDLCPCVCQSVTLFHKSSQNVAPKFLQHAKESLGVLRQASKHQRAFSRSHAL